MGSSFIPGSPTEVLVVWSAFLRRRIVAVDLP